MGFEIKNGVLTKYKDEVGVTDIVIPAGVVSIDENAFSNRWGIKSITIPEGVKEIGKWAFRNCKKLTQINIPNSPEQNAKTNAIT